MNFQIRYTIFQPTLFNISANHSHIIDPQVGRRKRWT